MQIVVMGMHRSGTSLVTRLINLMGAHVGSPEETTAPSRNNPRGFWERREVRALNDATLAAAGADWNRVSGFSIDALPDEALARFAREAPPIVAKLDAHRPWVAKEPRFCLLFPLWREHLTAPVCVLVHRHPLQVAASIRARNGYPLIVGLALWERYVRSALAVSRGLPRVLVAHRDFMADPIAATRDLRDRLVALGVDGLEMPADDEIRAFVDPALYHQRQDPGSGAEYLRPPQRALLEALESGEALDRDLDADVDSTSREILERHEQDLASAAEATELQTRSGPAGVASAGLPASAASARVRELSTAMTSPGTDFDLAILIVNGREGHHDGVPWLELCLDHVLANTSPWTRWRVFVWNHEPGNPRVAACLGRDERIEVLDEASCDLGVYEGPTYDAPMGNLFHGYHPHRTPLQLLFDHASGRYRFDYVFTFDTDSWPVRPLWDLRMLTALRGAARLVGVWRDELRPNVTPFVHPSGLGIACATVRELGLRFDRKPQTFEEDTLSHFTRAVEERFGEDAVDRLERSNRAWRHPVFGGVYGDWIYHHHLGTRLQGGKLQKVATKGWEERGEALEENRRALLELTEDVFAEPEACVLGLRYGERLTELRRLAAELPVAEPSRREAIFAAAQDAARCDPLRARYLLDLLPPDVAEREPALACAAQVAEALGRTGDAAAYRVALGVP